MQAARSTKSDEKARRTLFRDGIARSPRHHQFHTGERARPQTGRTAAFSTVARPLWCIPIMQRARSTKSAEKARRTLFHSHFFTFSLHFHSISLTRARELGTKRVGQPPSRRLPVHCGVCRSCRPPGQRKATKRLEEHLFVTILPGAASPNSLTRAREIGTKTGRTAALSTVADRLMGCLCGQSIRTVH